MLIQTAEEKVQRAHAMDADTIGTQSKHSQQVALQVAARQKAEGLVEKLRKKVRQAPLACLEALCSSFDPLELGAHGLIAPHE